VYEEALCYELTLRDIAYSRQHIIAVSDKGRPVGKGIIDILVADRLIVELKAVESLLPIHTAQALSYLRATRCPLALLLNFNVPMLKQGRKRIILT
jgi:GxxExxY protein